MKKTLTLIVAFTLLQSSLVFAQPSKELMAAKVKNEFKLNLISHKLIGPGGIDREFKDGYWADYFTQPFEIVQKSDYPEFPLRYKASIIYIKSGGSWLFKQFTVGSASYLNVPTPNKDEVLKLLKSDVSKWIDTRLNYAVGEIESVQFATDPEWYNRTPNDVDFYITTVFTEKISDTELEKAEHLYRITMKRDNLNDSWKLHWGNEKTDMKKSLAKTTHTPQEIQQMKSLGQIAEEAVAQSALNALPTVENAPVFQSDKQLFYYLHDKLLQAPDGPTAEAHIMKLVDTTCYRDGSSLFLEPYHAEWINNLVTNIDKYKKAFCPFPGVKAEQYGRIELLNRTFTNYVTMNGKPSNGTWKIIDLRFYPPNDAMLQQMEGNDTNCQPKPDLTVKEVIRYKVGDKVNVQFSNGTFPCTIDKTDPNYDNRYFVKLDTDKSGKGYWVDASFISKK